MLDVAPHALLAPFIATEAGEGHRAVRLGLRLGGMKNAQAALEIGRREQTLRPPEAAISLQARLRW